MELWNDFEGKVIDDRYRLGRLLAPKGRSAFFAATTLSGEPLTMRLIESLNDEDEILSRWRVVEGISEPHLQAVSASGQTVLDGTHLVYAAMEPVDMALEEVLRDRALTGDETRQMAGSVVAGLEALHRAGLVHEHVDAASVLARGETVKLRSDCVREAPEGADGDSLRRRDAHDLAVLVAYALTQRRDAATGTLPRQFEDLVRNGISGTWGMKEMGALLRPAAATASLPPAGTAPGARATTAGPKPTLVNGIPFAVSAGKEQLPAGSSAVGISAPAPTTQTSSKPSTPVLPVAAPVKEVSAAGSPAAQRSRGAGSSAVASALLEEEAAAVEPERPSVGVGRALAEPDEPVHTFSRKPWIAAGVAALVLLLLIWHFARRSATPAAPAAQPAATGIPPATEVPVKPSPSLNAAGAPVHSATSRVPAPSSAAAQVVGAAGTGTWRVITYTYMHREQAERKAEQISGKHPELHAQAYSPNGSAPFLVALGGGLTEREAEDMRNRARTDGLPRDTFIRNYRGR